MLFRCIALVLLTAQCAVAATANSSCSAATGWATTPTNVLADDANSAQTAVSGQPQLLITSCAMGLPAGSTVQGIQVQVKGCGSGTTGQRRVDVNLLGLGTCTAKLALSQASCPTMTDQTVGGTADLWSCTSVSDTNVNATTFGASIQTNTSNSSNVQAQWLQLIVTYTAPAAGGPRRVFQFGGS
jgi:hypothetical protein